eukprot:6707517-Pyramimonas_sp.AAC.4
MQTAAHVKYEISDAGVDANARIRVTGTQSRRVYATRSNDNRMSRLADSERVWCPVVYTSAGRGEVCGLAGEALRDFEDVRRIGNRHLSRGGGARRLRCAALLLVKPCTA